ncbi:MAG: hypothetical protein R6W78_09525 [Bacteroidales bacterium]
MKKAISKILTFTFVILLSGCAATYKPINPPRLNYTSHDLQDGIGLSYKHDVLRENGNNKYAKKEYKRGIKLIAIKITNYTDSVINIGKDAAFFSGQSQIFPMEPIVIKESIKQIVPGYLPYLIFTFTNLYVTKGTYNGVSTQTYPIGIVLGPAITIGNMAVAGTANKNLLDELYKYNILNRDIQKGETVYGIIGIGDVGYRPISVKMIK